MPRVKLTAEQKRINKNLSQKNYYLKNRDKILLKLKEYNETHKDESQEYRDTHKEELAEYNKEYRQTPAGIKSTTLNNWKIRGITFGDMTDSEYYDKIYLPATICQSCEKVFNNEIQNDKKNADHKHDRKDPCNIRGVICFQCNSNDAWKTRLTEDSIYNQYF